MKNILRRKIDTFLAKWKQQDNHLPLIVKGARQIGKTFSIKKFAESYKHVVEINFVTEPQYKTIFEKGFAVDNVLKQITMIDPKKKFVAYETLLFFDELQACPNCATSLKFFKLDGRFDVICSGSLMGINYNEIESNSVGYKEEYVMYSLDFEEFLWAKGYSDEQIEDLYSNMKNLQPFSKLEMDVMHDNFKDFMIVGGMPAVVKTFITENNFSGILAKQKHLLADYEEDITKYAIGLDKAKIKNVYKNISIFLAKENKKFQISKIAKHARNRDYIGVNDWLQDAGIVNVCYGLDMPELPFRGNYNATNYKLYFADTGLLIASLDAESQEDLRANKNFNVCKGGIYENIVAESLVKSGYQLFFFKNEKSTIEMDFFVRDANSVVPVEVKASDNATASLNNLISKDTYKEIKYGIKFCNKNIGFNGRFYTFPYFLSFLLHRFMFERIASKE